MTDEQKIQSISVNLLRIAEWHYKDPEGNAAVCKRQLEQSKELAKQVPSSKLLSQVDSLSLETGESVGRQAERCLTLGVLLQA